MRRDKMKIFLKETKKVFEGLGIAFSVMIAAIGFFTFLFLAASVVRGWLERSVIEKAIVNTGVVQQTTSTTGGVSEDVLSKILEQEKTKPIVDIQLFNSGSNGASLEDFSYQTFYDLFSGTGWIDQARTTMHHDMQVTAFTFPPKYEWKQSDASHATGKFVREGDSRCIGSTCLEVRNLSLYFKGSSIDLPEEVNGKSITALSVGALDSKWRVGVVIKEDGIFKGYIFGFDGTAFTNVKGSGEEFTSKYGGTIGFGGNDGNWLALYGGYEGRAFHFKETGAVELPFFNARVMGGGFNPEITKVGFGNSATWYVWNKGSGKLHFVKLFQNGTDSIQGATDLTASLSDIGTPSGISCVPGTESKTVICKPQNADGQYYAFYDHGFEASKKYEVVSANISNNILSVRRGTITSIGLASQGANVVLYLSNDGVNWTNAEVGKEVVFPDPDANRIFWKAEFIPSGDESLSPFLDQIRLDFKLKK